MKEYRVLKKYNEIQRKVFEFWYISYNKRNNSNEKILSYNRIDTDYNYEITKNIPNNYYNKIEDEESIKFKDK